MDITRVNGLTPETAKEIDEIFTYQPWDNDKTSKGRMVREALAAAVKVIVDCVPACPDRSIAIRKIREARMDCNSAISFDGKY